MQNKKDLKPVKTFEKWLKTPIYFEAQNDPEIGPLSPHILDTSKSNCNEHMKQY